MSSLERNLLREKLKVALKENLEVKHYLIRYDLGISYVIYDIKKWLNKLEEDGKIIEPLSNPPYDFYEKFIKSSENEMMFKRIKEIFSEINVFTGMEI